MNLFTTDFTQKYDFLIFVIFVKQIMNRAISTIFALYFTSTITSVYEF